MTDDSKKNQAKIMGAIAQDVISLATPIPMSIAIVMAEMLSKTPTGIKFLRKTYHYLLHSLTPKGRRTKKLIKIAQDKSIAEALHYFHNHLDYSNPNSLTAFGWRAVAICLAKENRWEEARTLLSNRRESWGELPDLAYMEGVINAAFLLPEDEREAALDTRAFYMRPAPVVEGKQAEKHRQTAINCFEEAEKLLQGIQLNGRASAANTWQFWLKLTNKNDQGARELVRQKIEALERLEDFMPLAYTFEIKFDSNPVQKHFEEKENTGGLSDRDLVTEFIFKSIVASPEEFSDYIQKNEEKLKQHIAMNSLVDKWVDALLEDEKIEQAGKILTARKEEIEAKDDKIYARLYLKLEQAEGKDILLRLIEFYGEDQSYINLLNLVNYFRQKHDYEKMLPYIQELFGQQKTIENALTLFECMWNNPSTRIETILEFLQENDDLVQKDEVLKSSKADTLAYLGRGAEAKEINDKLVQESTHEHHIQLDINLAIQMGDWERFPEIANREWKRKEQHPSKILLTLAKFSSEGGNLGQAVEFIKLAVEKKKTPHILTQATGLLFQIGVDDDVEYSQWIQEAVNLSEKGDPVQIVELEEMIKNIIPKRREWLDELDKKILNNEMPLSLAVTQFGASISQIYLQASENNRQTTNVNEKAIIPAFAGNLLFPSLNGIKTLGLDMTSILTLFDLGLLKKTIEAFDKIMIAPDSMGFLFAQKQKSQFHQPKRARDSQEVLDKINDNSLKVPRSSPAPPKWLREEVGQDLAELLEEAKQKNGLVISPLPINKLSSFNEDIADLKQYQSFILSTRALARSLHHGGILDSNTLQQADTRLSLHDNDENSNSISLDNKPIYLSELALSYLQFSGLLERVLNSSHNFIIHPSSRQERNNIVKAAREGEHLTKKLDKIRLILKKALQQKKAKFLPRDRGQEDDDKKANLMSQVETVMVQFMSDSTSCDAVCIDERCFNARANLVSKNKHDVPIICTLHLLSHLHQTKAITPQEIYQALHQLRESNFMLVPAISSEIIQLLLNAPYSEQTENIIETTELRVLREYIKKIHSLNMVQKNEGEFISSLASAFSDVLAHLWLNSDISSEEATAYSSWARQHLKPMFWEWVELQQNGEGGKAAIRHLEIILSPLKNTYINSKKLEALNKWIKKEIKPLTFCLPR